MSDEVFHQPDEALMWKQMEEHPRELSTVVLHLAWREGLSRREIWALRWDQVDHAAGVLRLPDRSVPLEERTARALELWHTVLSRGQDVVYVACSLSRREQVAEQYISRVARSALDDAGLQDVRLIDLRHDFVRRKMEEYAWTYALRISGLSLSTYRNKYIGKRNRGLPTVPPETPNEDQTQRLWRILQEHRGDAAGIGLWLSQQVNLKQDEIVRLTWDQVDLQKGILHLKRGDVYMIKEVIDVLKAEKARRAEGDDPHVILTPKSRKPMDTARLSTIMRDLLIHGGMNEPDTGILRHTALMEDQRERILAYIEKNGRASRREIGEFLGVSPTVAYSRLTDLVDRGDLVATSKGWFPAHSSAPKERWDEAVLELADKRGAVDDQDVAELLHTGRYSATRLLKRMVAGGTLVKVGNTKNYILPKT